jgi:hypothetical protein
MAAPGRPNACRTPSRSSIATAASAAVIRAMSLSFVAAQERADRCSYGSQPKLSALGPLGTYSSPT